MKKIVLTGALFVCVLILNAQDNSKTESKKPNQWAMINNPLLKGNIGQVTINLPAQSSIVCMIARAGETKNLFTWHSSMAKELPPGNYDITFWGIKIPVVVEKGKDTRILAGVLNSIVRKPWEVWTVDGIKVFSAGSAKMIALPVGKYIVKTGGAEIKTTINDGQVSIFSFTAY